MRPHSYVWIFATLIVIMFTVGWFVSTSPKSPENILPGVWQSDDEEKYSIFFESNGNLTEWYDSEVTGRGDWTATKTTLSMTIDSSTYTYVISKLTTKTLHIRNYDSGELQIFSKLNK